jgi:hypothetical protein
VDPVLEAACEGLGIDPVLQRSQGIPIVIRREFSQAIEMVIARGDDFVEIVERGDGGSGQKQHHAASPSDWGAHGIAPPSQSKIAVNLGQSAEEVLDKWIEF